MRQKPTGQASPLVTGILLCALLLSVAAPTHARTRLVFFAGGQSNAKPEWASAIETVLRATGGQDVLVVHQYHPGHWLQDWYTSAPQADYTNDFFNADGTGYLQMQLQAIQAAGDTYQFKGFFWFQGEGDTGDNGAMDVYAARFSAMLDRLRQDLGLTNAFNVALAIIDLNQDPLYDNPTNAAGRTRADVEKMRGIQFGIASTNHWPYVDTRGYLRTDAWHVVSSELSRLGTEMGRAYLSASGLPSLLANGGFESGATNAVTAWTHEAFGTIVIPSDPGDGAVFERSGTSGGGAFSTQDLIVGSAAGPANYSGIAFFPLPSQSFGAGALSLTVAVGGVLSNANVDVWGLGYVTGVPVMNPAWVLHADTDTRTGTALGTGIGASTPTRIADNIVTQGTSIGAGTGWQSDAAQGAALVSFLNSLYASGARPGDYAVIRVNPDANVAASYDGSAGHDFESIRYGGSQRTEPDRRARLLLSFSSSQILAGLSTTTPRTGTNAFRFGLDATHHGTNLAWIAQALDTGDVSVRRITLTGYVRHNSTDPLLAGQQVELQFLCQDAAGGTLAVFQTVALHAGSPRDTYQLSTVSASAPTGTVRLTVQLLFRAEDYLTQTSGSAYVDDLALTVSATPEPDFSITGVRRLANGELELKWAAISNRQYVVEATTNLLETPFADLSGAYTATSTELTFTNHPAGPAQYYRVRRLP